MDKESIRVWCRDKGIRELTHLYYCLRDSESRELLHNKYVLWMLGFKYGVTRPKTFGGLCSSVLPKILHSRCRIEEVRVTPHYWLWYDSTVPETYTMYSPYSICDNNEFYLEYLTISDGEIEVEVNLPELHLHALDNNLTRSTELLCKRFDLPICKTLVEFIVAYDEKYGTERQHPKYESIKTKLLLSM